MNILLVTDSYPPEIRSASHLMLELAEELHNRNHQVTVITTWPEYNLDQDVDPRQFAEKETLLVRPEEIFDTMKSIFTIEQSLATANAVCLKKY